MKKVITVILSILLLTTTLAVFASCGNDSPEAAIEAYAKMLKSPTKGNIEAVAPEAFWNELKNEYDVTPEDIADQFEGGRKVEFTVSSTEKIDDLDAWKEQNDNIPGVDSDDISAVYICELETKTSRVFQSKYTVIELDGSFYAIEVMQLLSMSAVSL